MPRVQPEVHAEVSIRCGLDGRGLREGDFALCVTIQPMDSIIGMAFRMQEAVAAFRNRARAFYYEVMLSGCACPKCAGPMAMTGEGRSTCIHCEHNEDPTLAFQNCSACGGPPRLRVRRYVCETCGEEIRSQFLFDGLAFDAAYFRQKMVEHRERKKELRERVQAMLAGTRSGAIELGGIAEGDHAGLFAALDAMPLEAFTALAPHFRDRFDLARYQTHIQAHLQTIPINLNQIPPLSDDARLDRIWRFIAVIFLAHAGHAHVWQEGDTIMLTLNETHRKRQAVPGDLEDLDGLEGPLGGAEA